MRSLRQGAFPGAFLVGFLVAFLVGGVWCGAAAAQTPSAQTPSAQQPAAPMRQLVMPFDARGNEPRAYWLREASAILLTDDLLALKVPAISRDDRVRAFERLRVPAMASLSHATAIRIGEVVGASEVIVGSVELDADRLTVRARTLRLDAGRISPEIVERGLQSELFEVYARVARALAPGSTLSLAEMERDHPPPAAFEWYVKGLLAGSAPVRTEHLTNALSSAPAFQRPRLALWEVYTDQGEHGRALDVVAAVPSTHRLSRQARFRAAMSMLELGRHQDAFDGLITLNQESPDPALLNNLGVVQLRRSVSAPGGRASAYFADAARLDPADPDPAFNLGYAAWLTRDVPTALASLREVVRRNPADAEAHYVLGLALHASGSVVEGTRERELGTRLSSALAAFDARQGPMASAPRGLERLKRDIDLPAGWRVDAAMVAAGQRDQRELARLHLDAGRRLFAAQRDAEATTELRRAVYLTPYESEAHLLLGRIYLRGSRPADAVTALKVAVWSEDTPAARVALAEAHVAMSDPAAARVELELVLAREPTHAEARRLLSTLP